jgi:hypothetical protein
MPSQDMMIAGNVTSFFKLIYTTSLLFNIAYLFFYFDLLD